MNHRSIGATLAFAIACLALTNSCSAQTPAQSADTQKQIDALRAQVTAMQKDLDEIKTLLAPLRKPSPTNAVIDLGSRPVQGAAAAKVTLVELTDYQCSFCIRYVRETYPQIDKAYVQTGRIKYAIIDFPLESIHTSAFRGAEMVHCAGEQGKFWEMRQRLFANPRTIDDLDANAQAVGVDARKLGTCVSSGKYADAIRKDMAQAQAAGIEGTPSFLLAANDPATGKLKVLDSIVGALPFPSFQKQIDAALDKAR
jgi:protein-disulfide isomerase